MKKSLALVTDSVSNLPAEIAASLGVTIVPASFAFEDERQPDSPATSEALYARMREQGYPPRTFGPTEAAWTDAFKEALEGAEAVACLVTPFDVASSFTTASAAMLAIQFDEQDARIKIINPGVGSAGLASLLMTLSRLVDKGAELEDLVDALETLEPLCDSLFVPGELTWLERSGRLALIEERLGELEDGTPIVRVGTRITGVAKSENPTSALRAAVKAAGQRPGAATPLNVTIVHADAQSPAEQAADLMRAAYTIENITIAPLSATIGGQLGPGTIGIGVAPARLRPAE